MQSKVDFIKKKKFFSERRKSMKKKSIRALAAMLADRRNREHRECFCRYREQGRNTTEG